ncbi:MAG TPA: YDG domain-containing protein, partial [Gemmatimonadales bacterium]|nr:YDG domain-containing protein [Gemmatimonadales bacterium]
KVLTAVADANGRIFNDQYEVEESDVGVRFTLKATGQMSGRVAQTTFTDGNLQQVNLTPASATVASGGTATYSANVTIGGNANLCTVTLQVVSGLPSGATAAFSGGPNPATTNTNFSRTLTITTGIGTSPGTYSFTVRAIRGANCQGNGDEITTGTLVVTGAGTSTQVASNLNPSSFGQPVTFSATVATGSTPVTSGSVTFIEGGTCAAPTTTLQAAMPVNGSGQVTFTSSTLSAGSHTIIGCYGGSAGFTASSGNVTQTVNAAATSLTVAAASGTYQGTAALSATLTAGGTGLSGKTVAFMLNGTNVGSALTNGSGVATLSAASLGAIDVGIYPNGVAASFAGDVSFTAASASNALTVSQKAATITLANLSQTYDGTSKSVIVTTNPAGLNTTVTYNGSATAPTNAGSYAVVATVTDPNYQGNATGTLVIGPAAVTGHFTAANKQYDGTTTATILTRNVTGALGSDVVTLNGGTATFADKNVGTAKTVTATGFTLGGPAGANYVLASTTLSTTANITPRPLAVTATAQSKPYDGTTSAVVTLGDDRVSGDVFTVTASSASFADKHVGAAKTVTVSGLALSGADAGNYQLTSTSITTTADITPAALVPHITADNKIYDGTPSATILTRTLTGALGADVVMLTGGTATFADKHVGIGKTVTASGFTLAGADAGNYTLNPATATTTANITPRTLTVTADGQDKVYDATVNAAVTLHDDRVAGDAITVTYAAAAFADKNVGTAKPVSVSGIIVGGADGGNYQLASTTASATANITPAAVAPHITASNKEYDGTTAATILTRTLAGVLGSDDVALTGGSASFADKHAGNGKTVTGIGFGLAGADAGNYQLVPMTATTTADITPRTLAVTATGQNKVYDGTTSATVMLHDDRLAGDNLALTYAAATFADKNVGNGKPVTVNGIAIGGGTDAGNYHLGNTSASTTADITPAAVAPVITASSKEYDGTTDAVIASRALTGVIAPDVVTLTGGTASFADKNVGTGKIVTGIAFALAGADAGNYKLAPLTATTTADITPRPITVTANAQTKVYGDNDPALTYMVTVGSLVTGDGFTGNLTRVAGETVPGGPYAIEQGTLTAGGNYNLSFVGANLTITPAPLTVTADDTSKVFGDAVPAPLTGKIVGLRFSDQITVSYTAYVATGGMVLVGATTPVSGSPYPIIPSVSDPNGVLANYTLTPANGNLTVKPATPAYTASPLTVIFGTATTTIAGNVAYTGQGVGGQTVVPGGSVQITFNGMTLPATINAGGGFSANFNTTTVDVTGNPYPVSFNYAAGQDANFTAATGGTQLTIIDQTAPVTSNVAANPNPVPAGALTTLSGTVSDAGTGSSTIKQFEYSTNGGATWTPMALPGTSITQPVSTTLNLPTGVYSLCLRGTDFAGNTSAPQCTLAAVYDASAGFVTGGGWINSPAGAYVANPSLTGKANFGFVSKYQKGATVPTGDTEFQFQTAGLNFKSTSYDWLVISGSFKAQYKGTGTLNGQPGYSFMLTAIDGSQQGGGKAGDTFRIKIIAPNGGLVYDNQLNAPDTTDPTTILGGGSIVIHK